MTKQPKNSKEAPQADPQQAAMERDQKQIRDMLAHMTQLNDLGQIAGLAVAAVDVSGQLVRAVVTPYPQPAVFAYVLSQTTINEQILVDLTHKQQQEQAAMSNLVRQRQAAQQQAAEDAKPKPVPAANAADQPKQ